MDPMLIQSQRLYNELLSRSIFEMQRGRWERRSWLERLFSWPWRPWRARRWVPRLADEGPPPPVIVYCDEFPPPGRARFPAPEDAEEW